MPNPLMPNAVAAIADRMKELRNLVGIEASEVAKRIGISDAEYLDYETGGVDIPISVLFEVANILGVNLSTLLTGEEPRLKAYTHIKKGEGLKVNRREEYDYWNLAYDFVDKKVEPFLVQVRPDDKVTLAEHPGQEFNYVLSGELELYVGDYKIHLEQGDSVYFDSSYAHGIRALGGKPAEFIAIIM